MTRLSALRGVIHGRTIELESEPGLPDGQQVSVTVEVKEEPCVTPLTDMQRRWAEAEKEVANLLPGEGLKRSFGGWAEDAEELDKYLEENRRLRKLDRPEIEP